jgi:hypothetical protein
MSSRVFLDVSPASDGKEEEDAHENSRAESSTEVASVTKSGHKSSATPTALQIVLESYTVSPADLWLFTYPEKINTTASSSRHRFDGYAF